MGALGVAARAHLPRGERVARAARRAHAGRDALGRADPPARARADRARARWPTTRPSSAACTSCARRAAASPSTTRAPGYASLRHILRLRPDYIKLDMTLTRGIDHDPDRRALASSLLTFAREVSATVIAEGIETEAELDTLRGLGATLGQGYYLARPRDAGAALPGLTPRFSGRRAARGITPKRGCRSRQFGVARTGPNPEDERHGGSTMGSRGGGGCGGRAGRHGGRRHGGRDNDEAARRAPARDQRRAPALRARGRAAVARTCTRWRCSTPTT